LLLSASLAMAACFVVDRRTSVAAGDRLVDYGWLACAAVFALLSLDEMGSLHERIPLDAIPTVDGLQGWTAGLAVPIAAVAALLLAFAWLRLRRNVATAAFMILGVLLFVSIPIQE